MHYRRLGRSTAVANRNTSHAETSAALPRLPRSRVVRPADAGRRARRSAPVLRSGRWRLDDRCGLSGVAAHSAASRAGCPRDHGPARARARGCSPRRSRAGPGGPRAACLLLLSYSAAVSVPRPPRRASDASCGLAGAPLPRVRWSSSAGPSGAADAAQRCPRQARRLSADFAAPRPSPTTPPLGIASNGLRPYPSRLEA